MNDLVIQQQIHAIKEMGLDPDLEAERKSRELQSYSDHFFKESARIDANDNLSKKGKRAEKQKLGGEIMKELGRYFNPYKEQISKLQQRAINGNSDNSENDFQAILSYLKQSEIRQMFQVGSMDPLEIEAKLSDPLFADAIISSPTPLLPQDKLDELAQEQAIRINPQLGEKLEQITIADRVITSIARSIQGHLDANGYSGNDRLLKLARGRSKEPAPDSIKEMAQQGIATDVDV